MMSAVLSNPGHPKYGVATIPFPIPRDQYTYCMDLLEALEIGDAVKADCKVVEFDSAYNVLKRMEQCTVNVEELNYLAKRLESFDTGEAAQFQAMAHKLELFELKDLINLTFCCQQATVITDFSDLVAIGRNHYMNLHGGSASVDELNALDGKGTARQLIESGSGTITPYGVVYDNGMKLEQVYDGRFFPCYYYEPNAITVAVISKAEPEDTEHITWLFLPMVREEIDRALLRGGITDPADVRLRLEDSQLPNEVDVLLDMECETLSDLNELAEATDGLSKADKLKHQSLPILEQMLKNLQTIRDRRLLWSEDIVSLNKKISELSSQNQTLAFLKQNGLVDPDIFISKSNELTRQLRQAKLDKEELMTAEGDATAQRTRELIALLEDGPDFLDHPDTELCGALVAEIIVESNDTLRFRLHNGLELRESIERTVR